MNQTEKQPFVFLCSAGPWSSSDAEACLDALMTAAVFDTPITLVLHGDGVYQLLRRQNGAILQLPTLGLKFGALGLYGVERIHVLEDSMQARGLGLSDLLQAEEMETPVAIDLLAAASLPSLVAAGRAVFSF